MIEVPGYLAKQLEKEAAEKKPKKSEEDVSRETSVDSMYVEPKSKVLDPSKADASLLEKLPDPSGWRLLILPYRGKSKTDGGIYIPDKVLEDGQVQTVVGYVL